MDKYYAAEISRIAGFSKPHMLGYLERTEIFIRENWEDRRHGKVKKYTFRDLIVLRAIKKMLDIGIRPLRVKEVLQNLCKEEELPNNRAAAELFAKTGNSLFLISEESVIFVNNDQQMIDLTKSRQLAFSFMVGVSDLILELAPVVEMYEPQRTGNWTHDEKILEEVCNTIGM
ncbi:hypothetical protein [Parasphingorhabdus cellanae]|uniref:HTH merR-type domain-containing protein n=1 Tax=Parasphingorhabdus cellanae TaxID=2806553 RepID=A0ABX7T3A9_9SPHN|nr:hypothetical protein [Parasphingorhabdus cellanae]QTD54735.1 hypothetical protein J4G78_10740 [Parasphingorhabdus cellanae]